MFSLTFQFHSCDLPFLNSTLYRNHCPVERSLHKFPNGMKTGGDFTEMARKELEIIFNGVWCVLASVS